MTLKKELPLGTIPTLQLDSATSKDSIKPEDIVAAWLSRLYNVLKHKNLDEIRQLFIQDCWWRDIVGLHWDFGSKHGFKKIVEFLKHAPNQVVDMKMTETGGLVPTLVDMGGMTWIQSGFSFTTTVGHGTGFVKLTNVAPGEWKAWTIFTQGESINSKPVDTNAFGNGSANGTSHFKNPEVLVIGAGQSGVAIAARCKAMGLDTIIVDRNSRVGDAWRHRYRSVRLHTPKHTDQYPYLPFPEDWPTFPHGNEVADFIEHYAKEMDLDVVLDATATNLEYDVKRKLWKVDVSQAGNVRQYLPRHVILAAGIFSDDPIIPSIDDREVFQGQVYHTKDHHSADDISDLKQKKVVIIGAGTSAHDVAQDFVECGAESVTMVQKHPIFSVSAQGMENHMYSLWNNSGLTTEEADIVSNSTPVPVVRSMGIPITKAMYDTDNGLVQGLQKAGLALKTSEFGYGITDHLLIKGGSFYIDQGADAMIIDGRIKIEHDEGGVRKFLPGGIELESGKKLDADIVVYATGYHWVINLIEKLMGKEVGEKFKGVAELDNEQEKINTWRPTACPGLWYMTGSFMQSRQYSLPLALQIAGIERGLRAYERV